MPDHVLEEYIRQASETSVATIHVRAAADASSNIAI
jgi:hypothetical protein